MIRITFLTFFISLTTLLYGQNAHETESLNSFNNKQNIVYKTVDGVTLDMFILYPDSGKVQKKHPWMLHIHGGGWAGGNKYKVFDYTTLSTLRMLVDSGIVCVAIKYRRARGEYHAPDAVADAKDAARFLVKNAKKYDLDEKTYGVWGGSAGGHLSLVAALGNDSKFPGDTNLSKYSTDFSCVVSYCPFTSCTNPDLRPGSIFENEALFERILGGPLNEKPEMARLMSPTELLDKNSPPILLVHGKKDTTLPIANSLYMMEIAKEKNANVQLLAVENAGHSFKDEDKSPTIEEMNDTVVKFIISSLSDN